MIIKFYTPFWYLGDHNASLVFHEKPPDDKNNRESNVPNIKVPVIRWDCHSTLYFKMSNSKWLNSGKRTPLTISSHEWEGIFVQRVSYNLLDEVLSLF